MEIFADSAGAGTAETRAVGEVQTLAAADTSTEDDHGGVKCTQVVMSKQMGERSFGMSLVKDQLVRNAEFAVVSCIIPSSPACRAGIREGWVVLQINGQSARGRTVHEVALMFRDLTEVRITVEARHPVRHTTATAIPLLSPALASTPMPQPSIASDGFEIVDVKPGNAPPAALASEAPLLSMREQKPERLQEREESVPVLNATAQAKVGESSMDSCPKQVISPGASIMPKMAAKSMRVRAPVRTPAQAGAIAGNAASSQALSTSSTSTVPTKPVDPVAPRVAEPKQSEAVRVGSAGVFVHTNTNLEGPSTLQAAPQAAQPSAAMPVLGKQTIVTPVLYLRALPRNTPAIPQATPNSGASREVIKATPAPPLRLYARSSSTPSQVRAVPPSSESAHPVASQPQSATKPATAQVKPQVSKPAAHDKLRGISAPQSLAAASKRVVAGSKTDRQQQQPARIVIDTSSAKNTPPDADVNAYEDKAQIPVAATLSTAEDEYEEKAPVPAAAATQSGESTPSTSARSALAPAPVAAASNGSVSASRQATPIPSAPRLTISTQPAAEAAAEPATSAASSRLSIVAKKSSAKAPATTSSSGRKASSKTTPRSPPSTAATSEETPCTPPTGPRPLPPASARGKKRGRPKKGSGSASKASRRDGASSPVARWTAPTIEPDSSSYLAPKEEYTDPPIEMYQHLLFDPLDVGYEGVSDEPRRRNASRRARPRHSLTVERLEAMGFTQEEAELSIASCGDDLEKCMVWIVSHREELQFNDDLNKASIESEKSKRDEEQRSKHEESETLRNAKEFTRVFTSSFILSCDSTATRFKAMLDSTIGDVPAACFLREILTKLLKLESEAIRWYKKAARSYMLQLAERLEAALGKHDVVSCCSRVPRERPASAGCAFIQLLVEEERALKHMLFSMPEIHGGVPMAFLDADETMHFSLDDDGFEVVEMPPPAD